MLIRRIGVLVCLLSLHLTSSSQKKFLNGFFDHIDITSYFYFDDINDTTGVWRNFIENKKNTSPYNFDSLVANSFRKHYYIKINGGSGFLIRLQKTLANNASGKWINKKLEWRNGIGYRFFAMKSNGYSNENWYSSDTTKVYPQQSARFRFTQHYIDLQSTIVYKFPPVKNDRFAFFIGTGFQYSLSLKSRVKEEYTASELKWNTATRRWDNDTTVVYTDKFDPDNSNHFYLLVPMGTEFKFSDYFKIQVDLTYFNHFKNKVWPKENFSEGAIFSFTMRFKL
jgi:hypothetical protein